MIIDDRDPAIQYLPDPAAWTVCTHAEAAWHLYNNSDTFSISQGAYIQYTFDGDAIEYWGNQGPDHGPCLVNIDGIDQQIVNSHATNQDVPILLWRKDNLGSGQNHTIRITVVDASCPNTCEIDRLVVNKTTSVIESGGSNSNNPPDGNNSDHPDGNNSDQPDGNNTPPWAAIGGAIAGAAILLVLLGCFFWYRRRNAQARDLENTAANIPEPTDTKDTSVLLATAVGGGSDQPLVESYQQPQQQIAPCSFKAVVKGDEAIGGVLMEKQVARKEYKQAVAAGKTAYLLEQETPDVFHASLGNINPTSELKFRIPFISITGDNQPSTGPVSSAVAPRHKGASTSSSMQLLNHGKHADSIKLPEPADASSLPGHQVSINLGSPARGLTGNWRLSDGAVYPPEFSEKEIVITISPRKPDVEHPILVGGVQTTEDVGDLIAVSHSTPELLPAQEYIFLVDRSTSMTGRRITMARGALTVMLAGLSNHPELTSFNIISFGTKHDSLWPTSRKYTEERRHAAATHIDTIGANYPGTEIAPALEYTFQKKTKQLVNGKPIPVAVLLLTDGETGDISNIVATVSRAVAQAEREGALLRVYVVGIGNRVSTYVCEEIARAGRGRAVYVRGNDLICEELMDLLDEARRADIKAYNVSRAPDGPPGPRGLRSHQFNRLTTQITMGGSEASQVVEVQVEPLQRGTSIHGFENAVGKTDVGIDQPRGQYSPTSSFLLVIDAQTKKVAGPPAAAPTSTPSQSGFDPLLNRKKSTVESMAIAQQFDGSFPVDDEFIRHLTGLPVAPPLPEELNALSDSQQDKQAIWVTLLALAVFAKNLSGDVGSWTMLAEKAEKFVRKGLISLSVDDAGVAAMMNRLKRAAARYVCYKFWFPISKGPNAVVILVVSIDG